MLIACALLAIIPIILMEKSRRQIWSIFFKTPVAIVRIIVQEYNERFGLITGENYNVEHDEG